MSDASVATALRSPARLVVVEAPAGCGKTFQGAEYARDISGSIGNGRVLILAHTHAACDVFASRTCGGGGRVEIRTIDSLIGEVATIYHASVGLPPDAGAWARSVKGGYAVVATKVAALLRSSPMIARSVAQRYPIVVCDEHQDASVDQHSAAMSLHGAGASVRVFGDPMQRIYGSKKKSEVDADIQRWDGLKKMADAFDQLDHPHRWSDGAAELGEWILAARAALCNGGQVDLRSPLPPGVAVIVAENQSPLQRGGYSLSTEDGRPIYRLVNGCKALLVLAAHNKTVEALHAFFGRRMPIWEGHMRENLADLVDVVHQRKGDAVGLARAAVSFLNEVATGFSPSAYGDTLIAEVSSGCVVKRRGKPAALQTLGRMLLDEPDHRGLAKMLRQLKQMADADPAFSSVKLDYHSEFWDAVRLGRFEDANDGLSEMMRRRNYVRPRVPSRAISTIHKAKGLECDDVLILPCDAQHFSDSPAARCKLYVAMSRAKRSLTFVVSRAAPSPLVRL